MSYLVINCFDWIGFHIVNTLLEIGNRVDGMDNTAEKNTDHLSLHFGRNSSFSLIKVEELAEYNTAFIIGDHDWVHKIKSERILHLHKTKKISDNTNTLNTLFIQLPLLFGEWMPMDEQGMYLDQKYISFKSQLFQENAVYIKDFIKILLKKLESIPNTHTLREKEMNELLLENTDDLNDNVLINAKVESVISHYHRFKEFY